MYACIRISNIKVLTFSVGWAQILLVVKDEAKGCRDISKLMAMVAVLCHLIGRENSGESFPTFQEATQALLVLLVNRYPKVCTILNPEPIICVTYTPAVMEILQSSCTLTGNGTISWLFRSPPTNATPVCISRGMV